MNERIALINPPSPFLINEKVTPNIGLLNVATEMRKKGLDIKVFDFCGDVNYKESMETVSQENFDIYGFSTTSAQFSQTYELLQILKKRNKKAFTVVGGAHTSVMFYLRERSNLKERSLDPNIKTLEEFDLILAGEGEFNFEQIFKKGPKWRKSSLIKNLDDVTIPDRNFYDIKSYHYKIKDLESTSLLTQRGCPFKCTFCCGRDIDTYNVLRFFSPEKVLEELDYLNKEFGFKAFMWQDEEINLSPNRLIKISKLLQKRDYIHRGMIRSDLLTRHPETLDALADAGFVELCAGIESGSDKVLKAIDKRISVEQNLKAVEITKNKGITFKAFTMLGLPSETYEDIMLTKQWLLEAEPNSFDMAILQPYPGSIIYDNSTPSKRFKNYGYEYKGQLFFNRIDFSKVPSFYKGIPGKYECSVRTEELSSNDLIRIRDDLEKEINEKLYGKNKMEINQ